MIVLILSSIESDIINAYNSYKFIKAEVITFEYNTFYVDVHSGYKKVPKSIIKAKGYAEYDLLNKKDNYYLMDIKRQTSFNITTSYDENTKTASAKIIYLDKTEDLNLSKFLFISPYALIKYLLSNNFEHNISINGDEIKLEIYITQTKKLISVLDRNNYAIKSVSYISNPFNIITGRIIFSNIEIQQ